MQESYGNNHEITSVIFYKLKDIVQLKSARTFILEALY